MLNWIRPAVAALAMLVVAMPSWAQDNAAPAEDQRSETTIEAEPTDDIFLDRQAEEQYLARDLLIGAKVRNDDGKIVGDIEDIVLNDWNRVVGVVMGTGGFLGVAEKKIGVQLSALKFDQQDGKTVVRLPGITNEMIKDIPAFERKQPKKSILERAMEKARELTDKTAETSKTLYNKAKEEAGPAYERAKQAASDAYEKTKDAASDAYNKAKDAAGDAVDRAKDAARPQPGDEPAPSNQ